MIPRIAGIIVWKRIKIALQNDSGQHHDLLLSLLFRDANSTPARSPSDGCDLRTTAAAAIVAWLHNNMEYVEINVESTSSNVDGDGLFRGRDVDAPFVILILGLKTSFELLKVGVADVKTPRRGGRLLHGGHCRVDDL